MDLASLRVLFSYSGLSELEGDANRTFQNVSRNVGMAMTAVGAAITGAFGVATHAAMDFERWMRNVGTLGASNMEELREGVLDYSTAMGQNAVQATTDLYQILSKGIPEENALEVLNSSAKAAAAGVGQVSDALDLGTSIINAYGEEVSSFEHIMGNAVSAVKYGSTTIGDMGTVIGRVAPIASQAGVSVNELFAAIAAITATGTKTTEAISGLRQAFANVIKPSSDAQAVAELLGVEFSVVGLKAKGLEGFLDDLVDKVEKGSKELGGQKKVLEQLRGQLDANTVAAQQRLTVVQQEIPAVEQAIAAARAQGVATVELEQKLKALREEEKGLVEEAKGFEQQIKALKEQYEGLEGVSEDTLTTMAALFGSVQGLNAVLALTAGKGGEIFKKSLNEMQDGAKTLNEVFEEWRKQNPELAYRQAKAALSQISIEIGTVLLPVLADLVQMMIPIAKWVTEFIRENPRLAKGLILAVGAFGAFNLTLGPIIYKLPMLIGLFKALAGLKIAGAISGAASAMAGLGGAVAGSSAALLALLPVLAVVATALLFTIPMVYAAGKAMLEWRDAVEQKRQSEERLAAQIELRIQQLEKQGIAIDRAKVAEMEATEQILYLNELERNSQDEVLKKHLETLAGKEAAQQHFAAAKNLLLNKEISAEEAAAVAIMEISNATKSELMRADAEETENILRFLGVRTGAKKAAAEEEQQAAKETVAAQQETVAGMQEVARNLDGATDDFGRHVQRRTETVSDFMETATRESGKSVTEMGEQTGEAVDKFSTQIYEASMSNEEALRLWQDGFAQLPQIANPSLQETAAWVRIYVQQMNEDMERARMALLSLDAQARHSPSINDRIRGGLEAMTDLVGSSMSEIQRQIWETRDEWMGRWELPTITLPQVGSTRQAADELSRQYETVRREPQWEEFSRAGRFAQQPAVAAAPAGGDVYVQIPNLTVSNELDVEKVINEIARGVKRQMIMGGQK